jgi:hypothetical protein
MSIKIIKIFQYIFNIYSIKSNRYMIVTYIYSMRLLTQQII